MRTKIFAGLIILIVCIWAGGCSSATSVPTAQPTPTALPTTPPEPITLEYIGHSCTLITAPDGTRIISEPYGANHPKGLADLPAELTADGVTVSHFHPDHSNVKAVTGEPQVITEPGSFEAGEVKITGYKSDHGLVNDKPSGANVVFVFEIGDAKVVHLGAAGVVTQSDILAAMENADVIIVDIMGDAAHPLADELDQLLERNVRTIIPTHYSFEENAPYYGSVTLDEFLAIVPSDLTIVKQESTLQITANMPKQLVVLAPSANENE